MNDFIKAPVILAGYFVFAPLLGILIKGNRAAQHAVMFMMVFMTSWHINKFTLMLNSVETYRGHTKGFEFSFIEILAIALIVAALLGRKPGDKTWVWVPPGLLLYLLYVGISWFSIFVAPGEGFLYAVMAGVRFTKCIVIFLAAYFYVREPEDLHVILKSFVATLVLQAGVVLKMKYVDHFYQIRGWFEHQNPLAMWAYLCGLPLLGVAMSKVSASLTRWYTVGFVASAIIVQGALSRGALACFALGVIMVVAASMLDGFTRKRIIFITTMGAFGTLGILLVAATIVSRFNDEGNEASGETREVMNLAAKEMLQHSPFGIGWNNFALVINSPYPYGEVINDAERERGHKVDDDYAKGVVESHYWLLLSENGWGGFLTYMLFIAVTTTWCFLGAWRWRGHFVAVFLIGLAAGLILTYLHSTLERVLTQTKNFSTWLLFLGTAARIEVWRRQKRVLG